MNKIHTYLAISLFCVSIISGCSILRPREVTQTDKERLIFSAARASISLAITEINKDNKNDQLELAIRIIGIIDSHLMPGLNNPEQPITKEVESKLLNWVPANYRALMTLAFETLHTYYEFPINADILPDQYVAMLRSFFSGIRTGAEDILKSAVTVINE